MDEEDVVLEPNFIGHPPPVDVSLSLLCFLVTGQTPPPPLAGEGAEDVVLLGTGIEEVLVEFPIFFLIRYDGFGEYR